MVLALPPDKLLEWLDVSLPAMLLGKKESDPTLWRILSNVKKGRQKRIHPRTEAALLARMQVKCPVSNLMDEIGRVPDAPPWERTIRAFNSGHRLAGSPPLLVLEVEAIRLERLAIPVKEVVRLGDFHAARNLLVAANMPPLDCWPEIISQIECSGGKDRFVVTATPVVIASTLYLLACAEVDMVEAGEALGARLIPEMRDGVLVRPMRRWLEAVMEEKGLRTQRSLARFLLTDQNEDTSRLELRKWWSGQGVPAWTRVRTMARAISRATGRNDTDTLEKMIQIGLGAVRLLDGLLVLSMAVQEHHAPYDPWGAFRDYPAMLAHARKVKAGLPA